MTFLAGCDDGPVQPLLPSRFKQPPPVANTIFPLHTEKDKRYLLDANDRPFLVKGDAAWSLIAELDHAEVITYLDDRKRRGFNTILVNLLEHKFSSKAPDNIYDESPFIKKNFFGTPLFDTPNDAYFANADWVIQQAEKRGILVLLAPAYLGYNASDQGWYKNMEDNGERKLHYYGQYLGLRYRGYRNIIWVQGGDYNPPNKNLVREIVSGIKEYDRRVLNTAHCRRGTAALAYWKNESWLDVNTIYTGTSSFSDAKNQYNNSHLPFFLIESNYEGEKVKAYATRVAAYQALLSGADGQVFGNNPIWHFSGPGLYKTSNTWQQALDSQGAKSMTYLWKLFDLHKWWNLQPDLTNTFLIKGVGSKKERAVAAIASDHSFAFIYLPSQRMITLDLSKFGGHGVKSMWYDPTDGSYQKITAMSKPADNILKFEPTGPNHAGDGDWVLILHST